MSIKSTKDITRTQALEVLLSEIPNLPNSALESLMDTLADTGHSKRVSIFENFNITDFPDRKRRK